MSAARRDLRESSTGARRDDDSIVDGERPPSGPADRVEALEARVDELVETLAGVTERLSRLERRESGRAPAARVVPSRPSGARPVEQPQNESVGVWATIVGRTFLILGGAYLLRALTEAGILPAGLGAATAFVYAHVWLLLAYRATTAKHATLDRTAYGVAFALIAFPLVVETTTRFHLLSPAQGALGLAVAAGTGSFVAWRGRLRALGWVVSWMTILSAIGAVVETQAWPVLMLVVVGAGVATDWIAADRHWVPLRIAVAAAVDVVILGLYTPIILLRGDSYALLGTFAQLSLFLGYMGLYSVRSLVLHRTLSTFERIQASAVLLIGYVGAVIASLRVPAVSHALGWTSLLIGSAAFAAAYFLFVRRKADAAESWFNTSYALVGVLVGSWVLLHDPAYPWMAIAVLLTVLGARDRHATLPLHGACFAVCAAIASGLALAVGYAFAADAHGAWPPLTMQAYLAIAVGAFLYVAPLESDALRRVLAARLAKVLTLVVVVAGLGGVLLAMVLHPLVADGDAASDAAWLAASRTVVIVGSALALGLLARAERFREARVLVYPLLALGGVKLAAEDLRNGTAVTLAIACVCYGAALVYAPRTLRLKES